MSEHRLRAIKWKSAALLLHCAACAWAITHGWPL